MRIKKKTELRDERFNVEISLSISEYKIDNDELLFWIITIRTYDTEKKKHLPEISDKFSGALSLNRMVEIFETEY